MKNKLTFIDLFAGIGGFHQAFKDYETECLFASEWDSFASTVYKQNFNIEPYGDITKIAEQSIPSHDILCAGFPCQAYGWG